MDCWTLSLLPDPRARRLAGARSFPAGGTVDPVTGTWPDPQDAFPDTTGSCELAWRTPGDLDTLAARLGWIWSRYGAGNPGAERIREPLRAAVCHLDAGHGPAPVLLALSGARRLAWVHRTLGRRFAELAALAQVTGRAPWWHPVSLTISEQIRTGRRPAELAGALTVPVTVALRRQPAGASLTGTLDAWAQFEHVSDLAAPA